MDNYVFQAGENESKNVNEDTYEAAELFSRLTLDEQDEIICLLKSLLSERLS